MSCRWSSEAHGLPTWPISRSTRQDPERLRAEASSPPQRVPAAIVRPPSGARKKDSEAAPLALVRLGGHATSMSLRDALHDREARAAPAPPSVALPIRLEDVRQGLGWDADPGVLDLELELCAGIDEPHDDAPAARGKADRIGAEIHHELMRPCFIAEVAEMHSLDRPLQG